MKSLTQTQIIYIKNDLKSRKPASGFKDELLDHMCTSVEEKLNDGQSFSDAYKQSILEFTEQGFLELKNQSPVVKKKRRILATQLSGATVAAMIFMMVLGVEAQDPPSINPLYEDAVISSGFGMRFDPRTKERKPHFGIDFKCPEGTPIKATADGVVTLAQEKEGGYGVRIKIEHDEHFTTAYAHLSKLKVKEGQKVKKGEIIGLSGNSGFSTAPHLHYEVFKDGKRVDPEEYFQPIEE